MKTSIGNITKKGTVKLPGDFIAETLKARREWDDILKVLKEKTAKNTTPANWTITNKGEVQILPDTQMLREFIATRCAYQEMLKAVLQVEKEGC